MDLSQILQFAGFVFGLLTVFGTLYWRFQVMIKEVRDIADGTTRDLAAHKLHVAETYTTKAGLRDITDQIMDAIGGLGAQITSMNGRIDRMLERPSGRSTAAKT